MSRLGALLAAKRLEAARARWYVAWHMTRAGIDGWPYAVRLRARSWDWFRAFVLAALAEIERRKPGATRDLERRPLANLVEREKEIGG